MLKRLEPWSTLVEIKGEAKATLQEQRRIHDGTKDAQTKTVSKDLTQLPQEQQIELDRLQEDQSRLRERTGRLLEKMERISQQRQEKEPDSARELKDASDAARNSGVTSRMKEAAGLIQDKQFDKANKSQKESIAGLEEMVKKLEAQPEKELDRLIKKMEKAEKDLAKLGEDLDKLRKKIKEANQIPDPKEREARLKELSQEQAKLLKRQQQEAQELLQQLSRLRSQRANEALEQLSRQMEQALKQLQRGENAEREEDNVLNRLQEARKEVQRMRKEVEEELAREQLVKISDEIRRLKERQEIHNKDFERIQRDLTLLPEDERRKKWINLGHLADNQADLGGETIRLSDKELKSARVFARVLHKAGESMENASAKMREHREEGMAKGKAETAAGEEAARLQQEALRSLERLLDALKPEAGLARRLARRPAQGDDGEEGQGAQRGQGDEPARGRGQDQGREGGQAAEKPGRRYSTLGAAQAPAQHPGRRQ